MSSSSSNPSSHGQAEASSRRTFNGKQPVVEDDDSDEEALLADDPLERDLPEQYAQTAPLVYLHTNAHLQAVFQAQAQAVCILLRLLAIPRLTPRIS